MHNSSAKLGVDLDCVLINIIMLLSVQSNWIIKDDLQANNLISLDKFKASLKLVINVVKTNTEINKYN